ncbi:MAG TPA: biotin--[acetyl-CoA-carboxylase] ligase [Flavobacteriaceae bacterium]|nr:biotin--[acetyl-CoA-carboxylase] ligase [Flavobacteriaceae bacterium]
MKLIKLSAIDSTNLYLKKMASEKDCENYTVVQADYQLEGRGQMGTVWNAKQGKNLTFSILLFFEKFKVEDQFYLSMAVSLGIIEVLQPLVSQKLQVKWPNDILAEGNKLAGILIENILGSNSIKKSVIGIGLNVNQTKFPSNIPKVTSLKKLTNKNFNIDNLLEKIIFSIKQKVILVEKQEYKSLRKMYLQQLYKYQVPAMFCDKNNTPFMGKIIGVNHVGQLVVEDDKENARTFNLKEIKFADK